jgi:hypothetical protein
MGSEPRASELPPPDSLEKLHRYIGFITVHRFNVSCIFRVTSGEISDSTPLNGKK